MDTGGQAMKRILSKTSVIERATECEENGGGLYKKLADQAREESAKQLLDYLVGCLVP